jgi:tetratricopeptide (TPR) repeat protein
MAALQTVRARLDAYFSVEDSDAITGDQARDDARELLVQSLRAHDNGEVAIDTEGLAVSALLFWCRWMESPTDHEDPDCQTAYRLYRVLRAVDPDAQVPAQLAGPLSDPANDEPIPGLLHAESRDLVESCLQRFDDTAAQLGIVLGQCAVALTAPETADQAERCCNLGAGLFARYRHHHAADDLDDAVARFRNAVESGFGNDEEQGRYLANLGAALHIRFQDRRRVEDLAESVRMHRRALHHVPEQPRYRWQYASVLHTRYEVEGRLRDLDRAIINSHGVDALGLTNLASMLRHRFEYRSTADDLHQSITLLGDILSGTAPDDPDRARRLSALAAALTLRFTLTDEPADLDTAVDLHRQAVDSCRANDPHRLDYLSNLGHTLHDRHEERGDPADLQAALAAHTDTDAGSHNSPLRAGNRANTLTSRFDHLDDIADLDEARKAYLEALAALPHTSIHRGSHLSNLGCVWFERFQRTLDSADLQEAISVHRVALRCTPPRHIDRSRRLVNLAMALDSRYERTGRPGDLDEAIDIHRQAYDSAPSTHLRHHGSALAIALHLRYHLRGRDGDLTECIALIREAVRCRPDHPDRPRRRTLLASALITRYNETNDRADITEAVSLVRDAAAATPPRHVQRVGRQTMLGSTLAKTGDAALVNEAVTVLQAVADIPDASCPAGYRLRTLGDALMERWEISGATADLTMAMAAYRRAIATTAETDPDQALNRYDLAGALAALAEATDDARHRQEAVEAYQQAAGQTTAAALIRIHAAGGWATQARALNDLASATTAFAAAIDLLPALAWNGLDRRDQERALATWNTLASDAAVAALSIGRPDRAVELGDRGRSLLWEQQLQLRREPHDLAQQHPRLAKRLERARLRLLSTLR